MSNHTSTPWKLSIGMRGINNALVDGIDNADGYSVANCGTDGGYDAAHIVRCVNAHDYLVSALNDTWHLAQDVCEMSADEAREALLVIQQIIGAARFALATVQ